jgi:hypothetical protein
MVATSATLGEVADRIHECRHEPRISGYSTPLTTPLAGNSR